MNDVDDDTFGQCVCGSGWFELALPDDLPEEATCGPAVCIDTNGLVTGYAGKLVCLECGVDWDPHVRFKATRSFLRVVE